MESIAIQLPDSEISNTASEGKRPGISDEELMLRYKEGDTSAFDALYIRHYRAVFRYICGYLPGTGGQAEEALQEVFLKMIQATPRYKPTAKFTTWLYQIVRNYCIDVVRKNKYRQAIPLDEPLYEDGNTVAEMIPDQKKPAPDRSVYNLEARRLLRRAIRELPQEQREVFLMRVTLDLRFHEIATMVGCSVNTIKSRMRYALAHLQESLAKQGVQREEVL